MPINTQSEPTMAQAIVEAHPQLQLEVPPASNPLTFASAGPVYRTAKQAALQLGFIEIDAECIAKAWQRQTERSACFDAAQWPSNPLDFGLASWPRAKTFAPCPRQLGLYAVLPSADWVARMAQAGVPTLQLRLKSDDVTLVAQQVKASVQAVQGTQSLLFINDHWQAAIEAGAYGVHLGQEDMDALGSANIDQIRRAGLRLGLSTHGYAEMVKADAHSPSYIAMGAVYATTLKRMVTPPQGPGRLAQYAKLMANYPLVAIGGIDDGKLGAVLASGVGSVAVVRAITGAAKPEQAVADLMQKINGALANQAQS